MAVYVKMIKMIDDEKRVIYQFGPNENQMGEIEFDKEKKALVFWNTSMIQKFQIKHMKTGHLNK